MTDPINLNKARKAKARAAKQARAAENRAKFGRSRPEKSLEVRRADKAKRDMDGKRLDP